MAFWNGVTGNNDTLLMPRPTVQLLKSPSFFTMTQPCLNCGNVHWVELPDTHAVYMGLRSWHLGAYIQTALPMLDADTREQFITGMTPKCWHEFTGTNITDAEATGVEF